MQKLVSELVRADCPATSPVHAGLKAIRQVRVWKALGSCSSTDFCLAPARFTVCLVWRSSPSLSLGHLDLLPEPRRSPCS